MDIKALQERRSAAYIADGRKGARTRRLWALTIATVATGGYALVTTGVLPIIPAVAMGGEGTAIALSTFLGYRSWRTMAEARVNAARDWRPIVDPDVATQVQDMMVRATDLAGTEDGKAETARLHARLVPMLQAMTPSPLGSLQRAGYYPKSDSYTERTWNGRYHEYETIDYFVDDDAVEKHRIRFGKAMKAFRSETQGVLWQKQADVTSCIARLVPPYRALMKAAGIDVGDIAPGAPMVADATPLALASPVAAAIDGGIPGVSNILAMATAFRAIDQKTVPDVDRQTVDRMLDEQLPVLTALYRAAETTSDESGKAHSRALLERGVASIDRALREILERHAALVREQLETQTNYLETAYPADPVPAVELDKAA